MMERQAPPIGHDPEVEELLESSWRGRDRTIRGRELRLELAVTATFLLAALALIAFAAAPLRADPVVIAVVIAYAIAASAAFPIGAGYAVPTQLFLVPMFVLASAALVPVLVLAGLTLRNLAAAATGRERLDRVVTCGGDAIHAFGPAVVFVAFAGGDATTAGPWLIALAFAAQLGFDFASSYGRDLLVFRVPPELHVRVLAQVWGVDVMLLPFGLVAAAAAQDVAWAALLPLPLVLLLHVLAADRSRRIESAQAQLSELERERRRHGAAIDRIGDALASKLDLGALVDVVTRVATEALDGEAGRGTAVGTSALDAPPSTQVNEPGHRATALGLAERQARASSQLAEIEEGGTHAIASPIGGPPDPIGVVTIARARPFSNQERALLARLCQQAAVSVDTALRHERLRAAEASLRHQAYHDALTGLANRAMFADRLAQAVRDHADRSGRELAVLFIDLDGFKLANDTLGHEAGDELLVVVARRISTCLRPGDTPARFGGDEFAALLEGLERGSEADAVAERLRRKIAEPISVRGREFTVHASIGLAFSGPGIGHDQLLRNADLAMYAAKQWGGDRVTLFQQRMLVLAKTRMELAQELPDALERGDFELRFQPIVDLAETRVHALEALVRWRHPTRGMLAPGDFIAFAERMGMIEELGRVVLDQACRLAATEFPPGVGEPRVSLNISPVQLRDARFVADVVDSVRRHRIAPERLIIEITESRAIEADAEIRANLHELHSRGVTLALDDFGTGYSSLGHLSALPIDVLKLDPRMMASVDRDPNQARLVGGVILLGRSLGLEVVVEGVERPAQLEQAIELGADMGQGFLLAEPMDREELMSWLTERGSVAAEAPEGPSPVGAGATESMPGALRISSASG
jgi:diguanylate cyclase (GGDEF)-like protein